MSLTSLRDLYFEQLRDVYDAEGQITDALPKMVDGVSSAQLRRAFEDHLDETREQRQRLEEIFERHGEDPSGKSCDGMEGLLEEGKEMLDQDGDPEVLDAGIIAAAQRVEHYEIAGYGTVEQYARQLGEDEDADLLRTTLEEEADADERLTDIATETINAAAKKTSVRAARS